MSLIGKTGVLAVGYLAGSRAGRHRYDQLVSTGAALAARPRVRAARSRATDALLRQCVAPPGEVPNHAFPPPPARSSANPNGPGSMPTTAGHLAGSDSVPVPAGNVTPAATWTSAPRLRRRVQ